MQRLTHLTTPCLLTLALSGVVSNLYADETVLCKNAGNIDSYNTDFLKNFSILKKGSDEWLFRDSDLKISFGPDVEGYKRLRYINKLLGNRIKSSTLIYDGKEEGIVQNVHLKPFRKL